MSYVDLALAKKHLAQPHDDDDDLIQQCIDAAEAYAADFMGRASIDDVIDPPWLPATEPDSTQTVPATVIQAVLILVGEYYENRQQGYVGASVSISPTVESLLHFQRIGLGV